MIYVMSDIHGNIERYDSIMKQINLQESDSLYVLGDVIDRYPDGIKIMRKIMKMDNVKMLLGNHEYMMLNAIDPITEFDKREQSRSIRLWYRNGGWVTHNYIKHIRKDVRREIFDYLRNLPINIKIEKNGIKYLFVHGSPIENYSWIYKEYETAKKFAVWERWDVCSPVPDGHTLVFGHTPTDHFQNNNPFEIFKSDDAIGLDCGCGYSDGRLACLRLDDMEVFYSE